MIFFRNLNLFLCAIYAGFVLAVDVNLDIKPTLKNQKIQKEIIKKLKEDHFFKVNNTQKPNFFLISSIFFDDNSLAFSLPSFKTWSM